MPLSLNCTLARAGDADLAGASGVDHADRRFLTDEDLGHAIVERDDARLGLDVGEVAARAARRGTSLG